MRKKTRQLRSRIRAINPDGAQERAVEPAEILLVMSMLHRWVRLEHRHKTYLTDKLIWIAARLLELRADSRTHWETPRNWPELAKSMGIDCETFVIFDEKRFKWFWHQVGETGRFSIKKQKQLMESKENPPEMLPLIICKSYRAPEEIAQRQQAKEVKQAQDNHLKQEIMDHFFV